MHVVLGSYQNAVDIKINGMPKTEIQGDPRVVAVFFD